MLVGVMHTDLSTWRSKFAAEIIGESALVVEALETLQHVADTGCSILITGETGTGKELFARAAHRASTRRHRGFVAVNCAAIPESLLETELFGHVKGAFTGATNARPGRFMSAHEGTIFLDEIGDLPLSAQAKLLRVLEERVVSPVGSDTDLPVDVRVIAATHHNLEEMVAQGRFRADLYFRLAVVPIHLPALRERNEDIVRIAELCIARCRERTGRSVEGLDESAQAALRAYHWPGNVRELAHVIERAVLLARRARLGEADLHFAGGRRRPDARPGRGTPPFGTPPHGTPPFGTPPHGTPPHGTPIFAAPAPAPAAAPAAAAGSLDALPAEGTLDLRSALENLERILIDRALSRAGGNRTEAAALLGLNRTTLVEKLRKYAA